MSAKQRTVFVKNLQYYMKSRHVEQSDIVSALGISASTVSDWANGKKYPRVDSMQALADFLGILLSDLTREGDPVPPPAVQDPAETELIDIYRRLNQHGQTVLLNTARGLAANPDMKKTAVS